VAGLRNDYLAILFLIEYSSKDPERVRHKQAVRAALALLEKYSDSARYADVVEASEELLHWFDTHGITQKRVSIRLKLAGALRMTGERARAAEMYRSVLYEDLGDTETLTKREKVSAWKGLALTLDSLGDSEDACNYAKKVKKNTKKKSGDWQQMQSLILQNRRKPGWQKKLRGLEQRARSNGNLIVADNILLDTASQEPHRKKRLRILEQPLTSPSSAYNQHRAILARLKAICADPGQSVSSQDSNRAIRAYNFFWERALLSPFRQAHEALWNIWEREGQTKKLQELLRNSSFFWRVHGQQELEKEYLRRLERSRTFDLSRRPSSIDYMERAKRYVVTRLRFLLLRPSTDS
jgi:hypothetical protein